MSVPERLEYLRGELRAERISYGELAELQSLAEHIEPGDVELLEAAGIPEFSTRLERFGKLLEHYQQSPTDYDEGEEEDPRPYFADKRECERYACVTVNYSSHGEAKYFFLLFDDREVALSRATENAQDDIFEELPVAVVDLDSGESWEPDFRSVRFPGLDEPIVPVVVVVRDPDASNEYRVFGEVQTYDIDAGYVDVRDEEEGAEWERGHRAAADEFERDGYPEVAEYIRSVIDSYREG